MTQRIDAILKPVAQRVDKLVPADRFYVALYDPAKQEISFPLCNEDEALWAPRLCNAQMLPDRVILSANQLNYADGLANHLAQDKIQYWPGGELPHSWLGVPLKVGERVLGALVVESWQKVYRFSKDHEQNLTIIARQTAIALENAHLTEQLERKVKNLRTLNQVGQQFTRGLVKTEAEIVELLHKVIVQLGIDASNMYIAFYDKDPQKTDTMDAVYGMLRFILRLRDGEPVPREGRPAGTRLTGYIIRAKKSLNPPDVALAYQKYSPEYTGRKPLSWLGVPMLSEGDVFGVIVLRNYERTQSYTSDDQEVLEILAGQAGAALQNLRLYQTQQQAQEQKNAAENLAIMSLVAAEFAHKMNNLAGTIPIRIGMAKKQLDANNPKDVMILEQLTKIEKEADGILKAAQEIRQSIGTGLKETVSINQLVETAINLAQNTQASGQNEITIQRNLSPELPPVTVERSSFLDTLTSIIKNGCESIDGKGLVTIISRRAKFVDRDVIEIEISDTGKGIPASDLPKIFDLFYTTKEGSGLGFGLWRDRIFLKKIGGELNVQSDPGKGSTFTIRIPVSQNPNNIQGVKP